MTALKELESKLRESNEEFEQQKKSSRTAPNIGDIVEVAGIDWKILDKKESGYLAITEDFIEEEMVFHDQTNNWKRSSLRKYLNTEFAEKIEKEIGALPEFKRDLMSLDGQTEYGTCMDKVSLLTVDEYRKYRKHLPNMKCWWWLCNPWSTPCNKCRKHHTTVSPSGLLSESFCYFDFSVRPVCIFPSSLFGSEQ